MKRVLVFCLVLATIAVASSPPVSAWHLKGVTLYFIDWDKNGVPNREKFDLLKSPPQKLVLINAPHDLRWDHFGNIETAAEEYQMGLSILYEDSRSKKKKRRTIWISKECFVEAFAEDKAKKDSVIAAIYNGAPKEIKGRIFSSKPCREVLVRSGATAKTGTD